MSTNYLLYIFKGLMNDFILCALISSWMCDVHICIIKMQSRFTLGRCCRYSRRRKQFNNIFKIYKHINRRTFFDILSIYYILFSFIFYCFYILKINYLNEISFDDLPLWFPSIRVLPVVSASSGRESGFLYLRIWF